MNIKRIARHLVATHWEVNRAFSHHTMRAIEQAIKAAETSHLGEIRFVVEGALDSAPLLQAQSARERAIEVFSQLRIWDTAHNNGVLIYVLLADRSVEIVADRGIHTKATSCGWERICRQIETAFRQGEFQEGAVSGITAVAELLAHHFPAVTGSRNELPDKPVIL